MVRSEILLGILVISTISVFFVFFKHVHVSGIHSALFFVCSMINMDFCQTYFLLKQKTPKYLEFTVFIKYN